MVPGRRFAVEPGNKKSKWQSRYSLDRRHRFRALMASNLGVPIVPAHEAVVVVHQRESGQPRSGKDAKEEMIKYSNHNYNI